MNSSLSTFVFLAIIFFPVALGFLLLTEQEFKMKIFWSVVIAISASALIVGG
jgi:hypothetical protein